MLLPMEVFPVPGGPTKQSILPRTPPTNEPTATNSRMRSLTCVGTHASLYAIDATRHSHGVGQDIHESSCAIDAPTA